MQIVLGLSLLMLIACSLFIGNAMSVGYIPYSTMFGGLFYFSAMFIPFLGEYNIVHRGFSGIGDNFKKIIKSSKKEEVKGEMEIILPSSSTGTRSRPKPKGYSLGRQARPMLPCIFFLVIASLFFGFDLVNFYLLDAAPEVNDGPISNF